MLESALIGHLFSHYLGEEKVKKIITLKKESMSVHMYSLQFTQLSYYAPKMVADMRKR